MQAYIFFRERGFYQIKLRDDAAAKKDAELNPGTIRVEDDEGRIVWTETKH